MVPLRSRGFRAGAVSAVWYETARTRRELRDGWRSGVGEPPDPGVSGKGAGGERRRAGSGGRCSISRMRARKLRPEVRRVPSARVNTYSPAKSGSTSRTCARLTSACGGCAGSARGPAAPPCRPACRGAGATPCPRAGGRSCPPPVSSPPRPRGPARPACNQGDAVPHPLHAAGPQAEGKFRRHRKLQGHSGASRGVFLLHPTRKPGDSNARSAGCCKRKADTFHLITFTPSLTRQFFLVFVPVSD